MTQNRATICCPSCDFSFVKNRSTMPLKSGYDWLTSFIQKKKNRATMCSHRTPILEGWKLFFYVKNRCPMGGYQTTIFESFFNFWPLHRKSCSDFHPSESDPVCLYILQHNHNFPNPNLKRSSAKILSHRRILSLSSIKSSYLHLFKPTSSSK